MDCAVIGMNHNHKVAVIEGVYAIASPQVPIARHRWGRLVYLHNIEVGATGQLFFVENERHKSTHLSRISNIIQTDDFLEVITQNSIYRLRLLEDQP